MATAQVASRVWWRRPAVVVGAAGGLFAFVFIIRAVEIVDVEAADSLLAAPIALVAVAFGPYGGAAAGVLAAAVFAGAEAADTADLTWDEVAVRVAGFSALGVFVGAVAAALERARARFTGAFDHAPHGILLTDGDGRVSAANAALAQLLARPVDSLIGITVASLSDPLEIGQDEPQWEALQSGAILSYTVERRLLDARGHPVPVSMSVARMPTDDGIPVIVHLVDLRAQRQSEEHAAYLTDHDPLTGLFNRRRFEEELRRHLLGVHRHGPAGAVLLLDLDHFKYINDTLGHAIGDVVLRHVADRLAAVLRAGDVLARLGGDEFAILLPEAQTSEELESTANEILATVAGMHIALPTDPAEAVTAVHATASIGAALVPAFADADRLLTAADLAMYEAKDAGPGHVRIHSGDSAHAEHIRTGFAWGERIRRALAERRFELHLQPIVALAGAHEPQYEVLLRLRDGDRLWLPADFLRHAERLGLMVTIDRYVVEQAVRLLAGLPRHRRPRLEVNLSSASLAESDLSDWVADVLQRHGVLSRHLIFEITETMAITNLPLAATTVRRLRARGIGFALDDFGVGVSSFYYLRELPFDLLKIDGEFVRDLPTNRANQLIVRAMIDTAHGLGKTAVAEYVESSEVADILRLLGCDYGQGLFFGPAAPAAQVLADE